MIAITHGVSTNLGHEPRCCVFTNGRLCLSNLFCSDSQKITRFAYFGLDEQALDKCLDWSPGIKGICIPAHLQTGSLVAKQREMYIAIPYHEAFFGVQTAINKVVDKWRQHLIESTGISYSVKIAWSRASDPLQFKLRRCCKTAIFW